PLPPNESRRSSFSHHRRIQVLRESHRTSLWASVSVWSGDQDAQERPGCQSRAKILDRRWALRASLAGFGGLSETEHFGCGTAEPHDSPRFIVSGSANDLSGPMERTSRKSYRAVPLLLQFHQASQSTQIRSEAQDTGDAGWVDKWDTDIQRNLLSENVFVDSKECHIRALRLSTA